MPVSSEYLKKLDSIYVNRLYDSMPLEDLITQLHHEWEWLISDWKKENKKYASVTLYDLASIAYEMLYHSTNYTRFDVLIQEAKELHRRKNAGYSGEILNPDEMRAIYGDFYDSNEELLEDPWRNFRQCETFGIPIADGVLTRLCDKYIRFWNVYTNPANDKVNESVIDTLKDFAAYCLILVCILEENNND